CQSTVADFRHHPCKCIDPSFQFRDVYRRLSVLGEGTDHEPSRTVDAYLFRMWRLLLTALDAAHVFENRRDALHAADATSSQAHTGR
ncbi:hypothetical protein, partial [Burkholderia sp. SIMBA_052]|uniref:hypothetical protein n=1 Tax=Burkholderia sp. SIMBA_052 TaxID=3085793 RepID=UPI00397C60BD